MPKRAMHPSPVLTLLMDLRSLPSLLLCFLLVCPALAVANRQAQTPAATSIWPELVEGMRLEHDRRPEVQRFIQHYAAKPHALHTMLARAEPFLPFILQETLARGLPAELALLPAVESSWKAEAVSTSSAHGLWQFIPRTGRAYGLRNSPEYNARRDPVASTRAALDLLAALHRQYGDWPLALAAYNAGGVKVQQAMRASGSDDFWLLSLPAVTRDYVPRLLAIAALVREPERHGIRLPAIAADQRAEVIAAAPGARLRQALDAAQVDEAVLRAYNPGGISRASLGKGSAASQASSLLLPPAEALAVRVELAYLQADTLPTASESMRDASASTLSEPLVSAPLPPAPRTARKPTASSQRLSRQMHWDARLAGSPSLAADAAAAAPAMHIVRAGDTLHSLARQHRTTVSALTALNPSVADAALRIGQPLLLRD